MFNGLVISKTFQAIFITILLFALVDLFIVSFALAQIALEGGTGYWSEFWLAQAKFILQFVG